MRLLVWQWGRYGTGARYAYEMARSLCEHCGHETLLSLAETAELMQFPAVRQSVDFPLRTYSNTREFIRQSFGIRRVLSPIVERLRSAPPDAAIVPMLGYWDILLVRYLQRLRVPVAVVIHDAQVHPGDRFHLVVQLQWRLMRTCEGVITLTDSVAEQIRRRISLERKVHATIPHVAFDFAELDLPPAKPIEGAESRPLRLLMAGRLKRYKGLEHLAEALKQVGDTPLHVRVVGAVQNQRDIASLAAFSGIEFDIGWKSDQELIAHLDWADAAVLPYIEASQSGIIPVSFQRARPVIATAVGGLPEQVLDGQTGLLTEAASPQSLANAIRRFAGDRTLLRRCSQNALKHAKNDLSWKAIAPRFAEALEKIARHGRN